MTIEDTPLMGVELLPWALVVVALGVAVVAGRLWRRTRRAEAAAAWRLRALKAVGAAAGQTAAAPDKALQEVARGLEGLGFSRVDVLLFDEPAGRWLRAAANGHGEPPDGVAAGIAQRAWEGGGVVAGAADDPVLSRVVACPVPSEAVMAVLVASGGESGRRSAESAVVEAVAGLLGATGSAFEPSQADRGPEGARPSGPVDSLTGLGAASTFLESLRLRCEDGAGPVALLLAAVDGVDRVATDLGARSGDEVVRIVARRLRRCLRPDDQVARTAPTVFGVLLGDTEDPEGAAAVGARVLSALQGPVAVAGGEVRVSGRVCVVWDATGQADAQALLPDAMDALTRADREVVTSIRLGGGPSSVGEPASRE